MNPGVVENFANSSALNASADYAAVPEWRQRQESAPAAVAIAEGHRDAPDGDFGSASDLEKRIARALFRNPYLPKHHLRFETHAGRVVLRGVVRSYFQKQMAQEAVRKIEGVQEICNELEVVG